VTSIATDGTYIYWANASQYIGRALLDGSDVTPHFIDGGGQVSSLTVASQTIFFGSGHDIYTVPANNSLSPEPFLPVPGSGITVAGLATADGYLYWSADTLGSGSTIGATPTSNSSMDKPSLVSTSAYIGGIATDGTHLYWSEVTGTLSGGPGEIYRATLNGGTAFSGTPEEFASEPNSPAGVAVDAGIDPTTTTVSCSPTTVPSGQPSACTATVSDSASSSLPTGTVSFTGSAGAFFSGAPCTLAPLPGDGGASCSVGANLTVAGSQSIAGSYAGDAIHSGSSGSATVCSGTAEACGGGSSTTTSTSTSPPPPPPPPPPATACVVPKLKGKSLSAARTALAKAHCRLGKVTKPKAKKHHKLGKLVVGSSKPAAGTKLADDAKVALKLSPAPKRHRHKRHR
jgi:hypothetical protein